MLNTFFLTFICEFKYGFTIHSSLGLDSQKSQDRAKITDSVFSAISYKLIDEKYRLLSLN